MCASQLPENMGKKIVEALKKKSMYGNEYMPMSTPSEEVHPSIVEEPVSMETPQYHFTSEPINSEPQVNMISSTPSQEYNSYGTELPTNVAVLKKLVSQLPAGVSKQVGAQIIRQTMEALGISMNGVLKEAQEVHNNLSGAIQECSIKVQEYKKEIMQLEGNIREFQRQMAQINDIISVFIMTDKK